jgi:hypothetical protein
MNERSRQVNANDHEYSHVNRVSHAKPRMNCRPERISSLLSQAIRLESSYLYQTTYGEVIVPTGSQASWGRCNRVLDCGHVPFPDCIFHSRIGTISSNGSVDTRCFSHAQLSPLLVQKKQVIADAVQVLCAEPFAVHARV